MSPKLALRIATRRRKGKAREALRAADIWRKRLHDAAMNSFCGGLIRPGAIIQVD